MSLNLLKQLTSMMILPATHQALSNHSCSAQEYAALMIYCRTSTKDTGFFIKIYFDRF